MPFPNPDTQFKKGNSGRPKGSSISQRLASLLEKGEINGQPIKDGKQVADLLAEVILKSALRGDHRFIETVLDRTEGKVANKVINQTDDDSRPPKRIDVPLRDRRKDRRKAKDGDPDGIDPT